MNQANISIVAKSICNDEGLRKLLFQSFKSSDFRIADSSKCQNTEYLTANFADSIGLVIGHQIIDASFLSHFSNLRFVAKYGVGTDNIDFQACQDRNVSVLVKPGVNRQYVAEHVLGMLLSYLRNIFKSQTDMRSDLWVKDGGLSLVGKTVGIVGFGNVGQALAKMLGAFDVRVIYNDIVDKAEEAIKIGAVYESVEKIASQSDIVSLHVPLTNKTRGMVDRIFLEKMKKSAILVNTSRGEVVDMRELESHLKSRKIAAACFDVFPEEPFIGQSICKLDNFFATPHIAANCREAKYKMAESAMSLSLSFLDNL